ncbi:MAG: matrix metalloproteinase1, partial [Pseudarthrobacter sp.]|nr:matrix metalloproteinase1 [Pseudarthrobacter sp.]
ETLIHEFGHVFGLRHFFADVSETAWPSQIFGTHSKFSIMNYGPNSTLTDADLADLTKLYALAWAGQLSSINGTPIRFVRPYSASGQRLPDAVVVLPGTSQAAVGSTEY